MELPHLFLVATMVLTYQRRVPIVFILSIITFFNSIFYHLCQSTNICLLNASLLQWSQIDYQSALMMIPLVLFLWVLQRLGVANPRLKYMRGHMHDFWSWVVVILTMSMVFIVVVTQITDTPATQSTKAAYIIIVNTCLFACGKVLWDRGQTMLFHNLEWKSLLIGFATLIPGIVCFLLDGGDIYWAAHASWHALAFFALYYIVRGFTHCII